MTHDSHLLNDIARATLDEEWYLVYQPEIDLHHGSFVGVEALLRWRHPVRGILYPSDFLTILEESGQLRDVGRWVLASACYQGADWHAKGYRFAVSVNISSFELDDPTFIDVVRTDLRSSRFTPRHLTLEFSADILTPERHGALQHLANLGVTLAIDDVVPGTPSVSTLVSSGVTEAKLDRQLVADAFADDDSARALHSFVSDARAAGLRIVAAGVEDDAQRTSLLREDVDSAQGFFFARPFEVDEVDRFLEDYALFSGRPL